VQVICPTAQQKYFCEGGLDDPNHVESSYEIGVLAHAIWMPESLRMRGDIRKIELICRSRQMSWFRDRAALPNGEPINSEWRTPALMRIPDEARKRRSDFVRTVFLYEMDAPNSYFLLVWPGATEFA
jgi:hypothetical protein